MGVYDGVRVLDLSTGVAGPMVAMLWADHGADVLRIERPGADSVPSGTGEQVWHRGKRRAELDLRSAEGAARFAELADQADVVIESFAPGTAGRLGVDHEVLAARNPGLVTLSISAYGDHPAHRARPGYDALVMARTGLLYDQKGRVGGAMEVINGRPGPHPDFDRPEGLVRGADRDGPVMPRTTWPSIGAMYLGALGLAGALRAREVTGRGQHVRTSLLQGALAATALNWQRVEDPDAPLYWMWPIDGRSIEGLYRCADGRWVHHWTVRPHWVLSAADGETLSARPIDTAYRDDPDRLSMEPDGLLAGIFLHPLLSDAFARFPSAEWVAAGNEAGMGVALVRSPAEALADAEFLADGCVTETDHPTLGRLRHVGQVLEFSATPGRVGTSTHPRAADPPSFMSPHERTVRSCGDMNLAKGPLTGIRVLDLGLGVAGPFTGRMLADLGADVIKVMALHDGYWAGTHMGLGTNRGKRSIALDLKHPDGLAALHRMVADADVVTTNWRPGAARRLGLDFETLHARHPRLIVCNTRGYDRGPRSALPGTDQTAAALTGTEWEDGACDAGNPPLWSRSNMGDTGNALLAAVAIVGALYHRDRTGEGQFVSTAIVNAGLLHTGYAYLHADGTPAQWGHVDAGQYGLSPTYRLFRCAGDEWVAIAAVTDHQRQRLTGLVPGDVEEWCSGRRAGEVVAALDAAGVPGEVVNESFCRELFADPEAERLGWVSRTSAGGVGRFEDPGLLIDFSATPGGVQRGPCLCGEHTREVLAEHGYAPEEIDALLAARAGLQR
ncbi:MAG: CoA transferase [Ilumatobacteraceae bacterium]